VDVEFKHTVFVERLGAWVRSCQVNSGGDRNSALIARSSIALTNHRAYEVLLEPRWCLVGNCKRNRQ
jgi:hypothetical protein